MNCWPIILILKPLACHGRSFKLLESKWTGSLQANGITSTNSIPELSNSVNLQPKTFSLMLASHLETYLLVRQTSEARASASSSVNSSELLLSGRENNNWRISTKTSWSQTSCWTSTKTSTEKFPSTEHLEIQKSFPKYPDWLKKCMLHKLL